MQGKTKTWYEKACTLAGRHFPWLKGRVSDEFYNYTTFTGLNVNGEDAHALALASALLSAALLVALTLATFFLRLPWMAFLFSSALVPLILLNYLGNYPKTYAESYKVKTLGTAPELINNMAISLKIVPNLEKAVDFAASKTRGQMGLEFKKMVWDIYMRIYRGPENALTKFSEKWSKWDANLASSIYFLKGSMLERSEEVRLRSIDRSVDIILKGTLYKIEEFARYLTLPATAIYFVGLILPLIMIAVLPTLSYVGVGVSAWHLFVIYDALLPLFVYVWSVSILNKRPVTTIPPEIPDEIEILEKYEVKGLKRAISVAFLLGTFLFISGLTAFIFLKEPLRFLGLDITIFIIWGIAIAASAYLIGTNLRKSVIRSEIKKMESELVDALMQIGNRISEGRPVEDAFSYVGKVMKGSKIGEVLANSASLMAVSRKTLYSALFDKDEGALRHVYSPTIRSVMEMIAEASRKGNKVAGVAINRTVEHLIKIKEIDDIIERRLDDVVSSMRSTLLFFGPFVGGVVVSIQSLMNSQLIKIKETRLFFPSGYSTFSGAPSFGPIGLSESTGAEPLSLAVLQLVIGIYLLEEVVIFSNFISELKFGDDRIFKSMEAGKNILTAAFIFTIAIGITQVFLHYWAP